MLWRLWGTWDGLCSELVKVRGVHSVCRLLVGGGGRVKLGFDQGKIKTGCLILVGGLFG